LLIATRDSLPNHVGNKLRCTSCHLDEGRRETGTWIGVFARYPQYRARSGVVETIEYRVNDCFRRSMNGTALDAAGPDMRDIVAYFAFLSRGVTVAPPAGSSTRLQKWARFTADTAAGARVFAASCAKCHGAAGEGTAGAPPLWGSGSYNIGAGMTRVRTAAEFISRNMPFDTPGTIGPMAIHHRMSHIQHGHTTEEASHVQAWVSWSSCRHGGRWSRRADPASPRRAADASRADHGRGSLV
jgi:thiosulfate dehydrogenase